MSFTFTAIDFETANSARASACSVGYTVVQDGEIVRTEHSLIFPPTGLEFSHINRGVHGIGPEDVMDAPEFQDVMGAMVEANIGAPLVAYSAFDKGVWGSAWKLLGTAGPEVDFRDALAAAKHHLELEKYSLPLVAAHLGLAEFDHHHAGADALACAQVVLGIRERVGLGSFGELWPAKAPRAGHPSWRRYEIPETNETADASHPLFGQVLCFTGGLDSMSRDEVYAACAAVGAVISANATMKTNIVIQREDPAAPGVKLSGKAKKALEYAERGKPIRLIGEAEFLALLR